MDYLHTPTTLFKINNTQVRKKDKKLFNTEKCQYNQSIKT